MPKKTVLVNCEKNIGAIFLPLVTDRQVERLGLKENEQVLVVDTMLHKEWQGSVRFSPARGQWYAHIYKGTIVR